MVQAGGCARAWPMLPRRPRRSQISIPDQQRESRHTRRLHHRHGRDQRQQAARLAHPMLRRACVWAGGYPALEDAPGAVCRNGFERGTKQGLRRAASRPLHPSLPSRWIFNSWTSAATSDHANPSCCRKPWIAAAPLPQFGQVRHGLANKGSLRCMRWRPCTG